MSYCVKHAENFHTQTCRRCDDESAIAIKDAEIAALRERCGRLERIASGCHEAGLLDEHGNLRKIIGTLPVTKDGCVVGHGASLHYPEEPYEESLATESDRVFFEVVGTDSLGETCGGWVETNRCYSTREAAERAANGGTDAPQ